MWVMCYTESRYRRGDDPSVAVGHRITREHPLVVVDRWNRQNDAEREAGREAGTVVLTWYAPLSETEQASLAAAGIDLTAVDVSVYTTR